MEFQIDSVNILHWSLMFLLPSDAITTVENFSTDQLQFASILINFLIATTFYLFFARRYYLVRKQKSWVRLSVKLSNHKNILNCFLGKIEWTMDGISRKNNSLDNSKLYLTTAMRKVSCPPQPQQPHRRAQFSKVMIIFWALLSLIASERRIFDLSKHHLISRKKQSPYSVWP